MANVKRITVDWNETGKTVYVIMRRESDGYLLNDADGAFASAPADPYISLSENTTIKGRYGVDESRTVWADGRYTIAAYKQAGGSPSPVADVIVGSGEMAITSDNEVYQTGDVYARIGAPAGASVSADVVAVKSDTSATLVESQSHPTLAEIEASTVLAKEATLANGSYGLSALNTDLDALLARLTALRAGYLDNLSGGAAGQESTLNAIIVYVDELESRLTATRAALLDNLDAPVSTRLASSSYTAPDNSGIAAIKAQTDKFLFDVSNFVKAVQQGAVDITQAGADKVWLTTTRTLTSFGTLASDTATAVWASAGRTLTSFGTLVTDVWSYATRKLTSAYTDETLPRDMAATGGGGGGGGATLAEIEASTVLAMKADVQAITPIAVLPFSGSAQASYAQSGAIVEIVQSDSLSIPFDLATDLTGYTVWFGVKKDLSDATYSIAVKEITAEVTDILNGRGTIPLTTAETLLTVGAYHAEIEIRKATGVITAMKFSLKVKGQVITP